MNIEEIEYLQQNKIFDLSGIYNIMDKSKANSLNQKQSIKFVYESCELQSFLSSYSIDEICYHLKTNKHFGFFSCPICGNHRRFDTHNRRYSATCGQNRCMKELSKINFEKTSLLLYGVKNAGGSQQSIENAKNTRLKRYGSPTYINSEKIKETIRNNSKNIKDYWKKRIEKVKQTKLRLHGNENYQNIEKIKRTNILRYGKETIMATEEFREKQREKNMKLYGVSHHMQRKEIKDKALQTFRQKHEGHDISFYSINLNTDEINYNRKISRMLKNYNRLIKQINEILLLDDFNKYSNKDKNTIFHWKCQKCGKEFYSKIDGNWFRLGQNGQHARCQNCYPFITGTSKGEYDVYQYVKEIYNDSILRNSFNIIKPYQIDIFLRKIGIGIEYNGVYYHSEEYYNFSGNHNVTPFEKTLMCEKIGIKLIHVWEDEWIKSKDKVKQIIRNIISNNVEFSDKIITIDRSYFNKSYIIEGYKLIDETSPKIIKRTINNTQYFNCKNCGNLIYERN